MDPHPLDLSPALLNAPLAVVVTDADRVVRFWNPAAERLFGWTQAEVLGQPVPFLPEDLVGQEDAWRLEAARGAAFPERPTIRRCKDGHAVAVAMTLAAVPFDGRTAFAAMFHGVSTLMPSVTPLPSRGEFHDRAHAVLDEARRNSESAALLFFDIDRFKTINDSLGHEQGNQVLVEVAKRLKETVPEGHVLAHMGQDEFAVFLRPGDEAVTVMLGRDILEQFARPMTVADRRIHMTASIGLALFPRDGDTVDDLLRNADRAMRRAKAEGIGIRFYDSTVDSVGRERLWIETELRRALDRGKLELDYQPIFGLKDSGVVGAEALVRWRHPEKGMISPSQFIPFCEDSGMIVSLDRWVLATVVRQLGKWKKAGVQGWLTANISPRSLHDPDFPTRLSALLAEFGAEPSNLILEITERVLADPGRTLEVIRALRRTGVRIAVDDFGTGYSSLVYLQEFPLDLLKVDQQFVRSIGMHAKGEAIAKTVIELSHNLGVEALAEGIEEPRHLEWLKAAGCDFGQGYHLGVPGPVTKLPLRT